MASKITIYNNTFNPITATVNYSSNKTKKIKVNATSHESWDNVLYNMRSVNIKNKSLALKKGITKKFEVFYDGTKIGLGQGIRPDKQFITPDSKLKYNEVCFLGAHNAHAAHAYGYVYAQQDKKIEDQLDFGARVLLLDTFSVRKENLTKEALPTPQESLDKFDVMLWHGPTGKNLKISFESILVKIKQFLGKHADQIITIQLENYVPEPLIDAVIERSSISKYILKPSDWNPNKKDGWPTLEWMINKNKRLVIFNSTMGGYKKYYKTFGRTSSKYCYNQWAHTSENQYGELDIEKAAKMRGQGSRKKHYLFTVDYFGTVTSPVNYPATNSDKLRKFIDYIFKNGLYIKEKDQFKTGLYKQRYPNVINLDYITRGKNGDPLKLINEINHTSKITKNRASTIFKPLNPRK